MLKRSLLLFFALLLLSNNMQAQSRSNCSDDSTYYRKLLVHLDTCHIAFFDVEQVYTKFIKPHSEDTCLCNLLLYARAFEYLLLNGLDIKYDMLKSPPITVSSNLSPNDPYILEMKKNIRKYNIYTYFIFLKVKYDMNVMTKYEKQNVQTFQNDINNTLKYNLYCQPLTLKEILSVKNGLKLQEELGKKEDVIFGDH